MNDFDHEMRGAAVGRKGRERALNVPRSVVGFILVLVAIHAARGLIGGELDEQVLFTFAFIPARYAPPPELAGLIVPGFDVAGAGAWSFVTHMLLHGDWLHLAINCLWMLAFGSVLARRLGGWRFVTLSSAAAAAGAAANLALYWGELTLLIGASGAISGQMAGAVRLMFAEGGTLASLRRQRFERVRALGLTETFRTPGALLFLAVWFGITIFAGAFSYDPTGEGARIAWEAHVGGFLAGLFLFGLFDPGGRHGPALTDAGGGEMC